MVVILIYSILGWKKMFNLLSFLVLVQVICPSHSLHSYQFKCNDCWKCIHSARMKDCKECYPFLGFGVNSKSYPRYDRPNEKKESKYSWQNIYSKDILDFSWIKNPTIK